MTGAPRPPAFDLVLATVGRTDEVERLVESLEAQTYPHLRLLVADQNGDDRVRRVLARHPAVPLEWVEAPLGLSRARNAALAHVTADTVAFPDDDCVYPPDLLERVAERLQAEPALGGVCGMAVDERGRPSTASRWDADAGAVTLCNVWRRSVSFAIFLRRRVVESVGAFDEELGLGSGTRFDSGEEVDYLIRAVSAGHVLRYDPTVQVVHPCKPAHRSPGIAYRNGLAMGRLLRRHYGAGFSVYMCTRAAAGAAAAGARRDRAELAIHSSALRGRVEGLRRPDAPRRGAVAGEPLRVAIVTTEPTTYRVPQLDRLARRAELDLQVYYAAPTIQRRRWSLALDHPHEILRGPVLPLERILFHDYPVTPSLWRRLEQGGYDVVVVWGWSVFASQLAIAWARMRHVPYLVFSESQLTEPRSRTVRALKRLVVPEVLRGAAGYLVTGSRAREHLVHYGADLERIRVFANTVDVETLAGRVRGARERRPEIRASLGLSVDDVVVLTVARLIELKAVDVLAEAVRRAGPPFRLLVAGEGPERARLEREAPEAVLAGFREADALVDLYAAADVFALLSRKEPWGVAVTEAAAAGLPLVVSDRVGAGADLVVPGRNGERVPVDDPDAAARALRPLADVDTRLSRGRASSEVASAWGYGPSEDAFVAAAAAAASGEQRSAVARPSRDDDGT